MTVTGSVEAPTSGSTDVELYANSACDPSSYGEGEILFAMDLDLPIRFREYPWTCHHLRQCRGSSQGLWTTFFYIAAITAANIAGWLTIVC